ncbi:MAG TPA: Dabb family protein [Vicinamibacterales bacterium]|jgi:hypothetical protein
MVVRIILFALRPDLSDYDSRILLATINGTVKSVPGILSFNVGRRLETDGTYRLGGTLEAAPGPDYDYAAVFQFEDKKALQNYLHHPAQHELKTRFVAAVTAATTADFEM